MTGFGALQGLRVLDLTQMLAGPYCTMMLADHGAEVIKIEAPTGDMTRPVGPFMSDDDEKTHGGYFQSVNRNKKSLALDLKSEEDREIFLQLVDTADAVVENFRVVVMDRLGLGYEVLAKRNPKLVYGALTGFGDPRTGESPYKDWPAFDVVAQAMGGIMGITGTDDGVPTKIGPGVGDIIPGMHLAIGVLTALLHAQKSGEGQYVDVAMADSILAICERIVYQHSMQGLNPGPEGNHHPFLSPFGIFPAKDGYVTLAAPQDKSFVALCNLLGIPEYGENPAYATMALRSKNRATLYPALSEAASKYTKAELIGILGGKIPFGPVMQMAEIAEDPHFAAREMLAEVEVPGSARKSQIAGTPIKMTKTPGQVKQRGPLLDENREELLRELGITPTAIKEAIS